MIPTFQDGGFGRGDAVATVSTNPVLMLHLDGTNGSTTIVDSGPRARTVTCNGQAQISTAQSKFGGASALFDGANDSLFMSASTDFDIGTGDFTVEFFMRPNVGSAQYQLFEFRTGGFTTLGIIYMVSSTLRYYTNGADRITSGAVLASTTWYHVALSRVSGSTRLFLDGTQVGSTYADTQNLNGTKPNIGNDYLNGGFGIIGYIDEVRMLNGVGLYSANFTAPASPFPDTYP